MTINIKIDEEEGKYLVAVSIPDKTTDSESRDFVCFGAFGTKEDRKESLAVGMRDALWIAQVSTLDEIRKLY